MSCTWMSVARVWECMTFVTSFDRTDKAQLAEAIDHQERGRFYNWNRHYVLEADNKVYEITLNFFERIAKSFIELFGGTYFSCLEPFRGKRISVLTRAQTGLSPPLGTSPQPSAGGSGPQRQHVSSELPDMSNAEFHRIITKGIVVDHEVHTMSLAEIGRLAECVLRTAHDSGHGLKYEKAFSAMSIQQQRGFEYAYSTYISVALNYLLLAGKIGYYVQDRNDSFRFSLDPKIHVPTVPSTVHEEVTRAKLLTRR